jgi:hypothetical protein
MCSVARWRALPRRCGDLLDVEPERERLVCRPKSPLHNSSVIPGKLAIASATRNPGKSRTWMPAFSGMTI